MYNYICNYIAICCYVSKCYLLVLSFTGFDPIADISGSLWVRSILDAYHKAKTERPHTKSRHGCSFSAIKMQRLPNRLLAAYKSCAYWVCCVCHARSILSSSFSKLAPFYSRRLSGRDLLAGSLRSVI